MDDLLYDDDDPSASMKEGSVGDDNDDDLANMEALLAQATAGQSEAFIKEMQSSKAIEGVSQKLAMQEEKSEIDESIIISSEGAYEEESFEAAESPSPKRVQSAKVGGSSVRFEASEESKERETSRPQSSPAGKGSDTFRSGASSTKSRSTEEKSSSQKVSPGSKKEIGAKTRYEDTISSRPSTAPSKFAYSTPGYDATPGKTRGRQILEGVLADIYQQKSSGAQGKMFIYENALPTGQVIRHQKWKYKDDSSKVESIPPVSMDLQHHTVRDYRTFRPTSANKRLMPSGPRPNSAYLLPGQKTSQEMENTAYDGKNIREYLHNTVADGMTKVEVSFKEWEAKILEANQSQCERLKKIHRGEMEALVSSFEGYQPSEYMTRLMEADKFPKAAHPKHVIITQDQVDYVQQQLHAQWQHNEDRMHVLRTRVKNRQRDELTRIKANTRAPNELLTRVRTAQEAVIRATERKITSMVIHADKILKSVETSIDPTATLRAQRAEEHCMKFSRKGIRLMEEISDNIDKVFEDALQDYISGDTALKSASLPGSSLDPKPDGTFRGTGSSKSDSIRPHSGTYTPLVHDRTVNGYRYRSRSPPRGSYERDVETERRLSRPRVLSARKGKLQKGYQDFLNEQHAQPYSAKQYGKGRKEEVSLPALWTTARYRREATRMQETFEEERPVTAPAGALFDTGTVGLGETEPDDSSSAGGDQRANQRPTTAAATTTSGEETKRDKKQKHRKAKKDKDGGVIAPTKAWDPSTMGAGEMAAIGDMDDDASLGIAHDLDEEMSLADSIGEPGGLPQQLADEALEQAKRKKRMSLMTDREKLALVKREESRARREQEAKKTAAKRAMKKPPNPTDEMCAECGKWFSGKSINPGMQEQFREKQMAEHKRLMKRQTRNNTERIQKKLVSARKKNMEAFSVDPNRHGMKVFCDWKCVRKNALRTCHATMRFDMDTLITLCSGSVE